MCVLLYYPANIIKLWYFLFVQIHALLNRENQSVISELEREELAVLFLLIVSCGLLNDFTLCNPSTQVHGQ